MKDTVVEEHESYGMVGLSRFTCGGEGLNLFGSSIQHSSGMRLRVMHGEKRRDLNREWYSGRDTIVEITLSPAQFAELITTPNCGQGVPCTLNFVTGEGNKEDCPEVNQRQLFRNEFEQDVRERMEEVSGIVREVTALLNSKAAITQTERKSIAFKLSQL